MSNLEAVKAAATTLNLLDDQGALVPLDSLSVLDLVNELERATQISIPTNELTSDAFKSLDTIAELLDRLKTAA